MDVAGRLVGDAMQVQSATSKINWQGAWIPTCISTWLLARISAALVVDFIIGKKRFDLPPSFAAG